MDDRHGHALQYGHLGAASYFPSSRSWSFSRNPIRPRFLSYTGWTDTTVASSSRYLPQDTEEPKQSINSYLRVCPELIPPSAVERTEELSELISNAVAKCDPQVSALLDFGNANPPESDKSGGRFRNVPIAVIASGDNGNILTFLRVENEMIDAAQGDGQSTRIPRIGTSETAQWAAGTAPIRQIRFADSIDEPAGLMAVRLQLSTIIFRPLFRRDRIPAKALGGSEHTSVVPPHNSHLDPNPVIEIATSKTGGSAHVDVTFNPWYQRQFAIIDENGRWSIWNISHRSKRVGSESASCVHSGSVPPAGYQKRTEIDNQLQFDGWGRVEWVGDVGTFVACSRRNMILYIFEGDVFSSMIVELGLKSSEWILDLKRSSVQMSRLFILTTLRIFCLDIDPQSNGHNPRSCIAPQLSWQHFRDPEDITLRLTCLCIGEDFYLMIHSRLNNLGLGFQFSLSEIDGLPSVVPDPFAVHLPNCTTYGGKPRSASDRASIRTLLFREVEQGSISSKVDLLPSSRLAKLFILDETLAIQEHLFTTPLDEQRYREMNEVSLPRDALRLRRRNRGPRSNKRAEFVVDDLDESTNIGAMIRPKIPQLRQELPLSAYFWTVDYTSIYATVVGERIPYIRRQEPIGSRRFQDCLGDLTDLVMSSGNEELTTAQTMLESANCTVVIDDIEESVVDMQRFTSAVATPSDGIEMPSVRYLPLKISHRTIDGATDLATLPHEVDMIKLYDRLIHDWLSVLPGDTPGRTRVFKEKMIRHISTELCLARMVYFLPSRSGPDRAMRNLNDHMGLSSPNVEAQDTLTDIQSSSFAIADQEIPVKQDESSAVTLLGLNSLTAKEIDGSPSKALTDILSHWNLGGDPKSYDWGQTVREEEARNEPTTPKRRSRSRRLSQPTSGGERSRLIRTSPVVPIVQRFETQPRDDRFGARFQSSQVTEENLPMTQVERGIFGGREAVKRSNMRARKKKRAAGF